MHSHWCDEDKIRITQVRQRHSNYTSWTLSLRSFRRFKKRTTVNLWLSGLNNWWTARYNYFTLGILFKVLENTALKFCSQDWFWPWRHILLYSKTPFIATPSNWMPPAYRKCGGVPTSPPPAWPTGCRRIRLNE